MASAVPQEPLLVVIGATGTGKSKLAVELATRFNGEVVNGDAMQMYKGLPIITNKIPDVERNGIPHHLIDFINLDEEPWTVSRFVKEAEIVVREIHSRGKLPVLVGGTHYYTQSLLFKESLLADKLAMQNDPLQEELPETKWPILSASTREIYAKLEEVDPVIARRWHPKDRRHIRRSLEIWLQTGRRASEVYQEQEEQKRRLSSESVDAAGGAEDTAGRREHVRYPALIFWLHAQEEVLKKRLNGRVQTMVANGLLEEASTLSYYFKANACKGLHLDLGKGIWVSIGYKEMEPYVAALRSGNCSQEELSRVRDVSIEAVMAKTRQYAKSQNRWIRLTLAHLLHRASSLDKLFVLDCTDPNQWTEAVSDPSERIVEAFLQGLCLPEPSSLSSLADTVLANSREASVKEQRLVRECSVCEKVMMTEHEWNVHLRSTGHKKVIESRRRCAENESRRQAAAAARLEAAGTSVAPHDGELVAGLVEPNSWP